MQSEQTLKIPYQLEYESISPKGYPAIYKQWINDPLTGNKTWANNDIIRWNFLNGGKGVFDPYRSFIQITVSVDPSDLPVGLLQIDNSAHSFIQQIVLYSNNRQIQRITEYGVILAYLNDIGMNQFLSQGRQTQGLGFGNVENIPFSRGTQSIRQCLRTASQQATTITNSTGLIFPSIGNMYPQPQQLYNYPSLLDAAKTAKGHITNSNVCMTDDINYGSNQATYQLTGLNASLVTLGYANNIRSQYNSNFISNKYIQNTQSIPNFQLQLNAANLGTYPYKFAGQTYQTLARQSIPFSNYYSVNQVTGTAFVNCANLGFSSLYSPFFTKGTFQPFISPTVPQAMVVQGSIGRTKFPIYRRKFKIPLASAIIGCLLDPASYVLLPLQSINQLTLQLTLDPFAMFTSGYNDISQYDTNGMLLQQKRNWNIERIQYKLHTYYFIDDQVQKFIRASLYKQISVVSNMWSLGNQYQIPGGSPPNNSYIIGCSSTNLNEIVCLFVSNDYQKFSFCRKHWRNSNNIKRFWSKLAVDYYPPQPFKGNGGNPVSNNLQDDNSIFIENIYWANNYMFGKNSLPRINIYNFSLNERPYDPTNIQVFYDPKTNQSQQYSYWGPTSVNADTAMGYSWIHQNRTVGKAAYVIVYTPFISQQGLLTGINVSGLSNFQAVFETDGTNPCKRDQTLYIFCKSSVNVKYTLNGIKCIGR